MKLIYIAGKYTGKDHKEVEENIKVAEKAAIELLKKGWNVFIPHKNTSHLEEKINLTQKEWMERCFHILDKCDAIFMLENWNESKGAKQEFERANNNFQDFYFQSNGYPSPEDKIEEKKAE